MILISAIFNLSEFLISHLYHIILRSPLNADEVGSMSNFIQIVGVGEL